MLNNLKFYTIPELEKILNVSRKTVISDLAKRNVPIIRVGGKRGQLRVPVEKVLEAYGVEEVVKK